MSPSDAGVPTPGVGDDLPTRKAAHDSLPRSVVVTPDPARPLERVMLIDDDDVIRLLWTRQFRSAGIEIVAHSTPIDALADAELWDVDLLICDIELPAMSGVEVIKRVREARADLPLIAISGLRDAERISAALNAGAFDVLIKPVDADGLLRHLANLARRTVPARLVGAQLEDTPYIIDNVIGHGGSGVVYRALHADLGRRCAIKLLLPDALGPDTVQRILNEARTLGRLQGPNFVDVYDLRFLSDGRILFVMEYLQGSSLRRRLVDGLPIGLDAALDIVESVGLGLGDAHRVGVLHLDVKPENIFLCEVTDTRAAGWDRRVRILDFGLSSLAGVGQVHGHSNGWAAPEQLDMAQCSPATDVFGLGLLCRELMGALSTADAQRAQGTSFKRVLAWMNRCTSDDPKDRFVDGTAAASALTRARARAVGRA